MLDKILIYNFVIIKYLLYESEKQVVWDIT